MMMFFLAESRVSFCLEHGIVEVCILNLFYCLTHLSVGLLLGPEIIISVLS